MNNIIPNTFIVGGSKCGTSALAKSLNIHPDIFFPYGETHFFSRHFFHQDISILSRDEYYMSELNDVKIIGDKSVTHVNDKLYLEAIKKYAGEDSKIIFMMRDPIDKLLSWYTFMRSLVVSKYNADYSRFAPGYYEGVLNEMTHETTFSEWLDFQMERYEFLMEHQPNRMSSMNKIQLSRYDKLIGNIESVFGNNCLYIVSEEFKYNRNKVLSEVYEYLDVDFIELPYKVVNSSDKRYLNEVDEDKLKPFYKIFKPGVEKAYEVLGRKVEHWRDYGI